MLLADQALGFGRECRRIRTAIRHHGFNGTPQQTATRVDFLNGHHFAIDHAAFSDGHGPGFRMKKPKPNGRLKMGD